MTSLLNLRRDWPLLWAAVVTGAVVVGLTVIGRGLIDLQVFSLAADALLAGEPLYTDVVDPGRFLYPPIAAVAYLPVGLLPWLLEQVAWIFLCAIGLVWFWRRSLAEVRVGAVGLAGLVAVSFLFDPILHNFRFGNVSLLLALVVLADLAGRGDHRWRGVLTGVAIGIKLTPAVFLPFLLVTRQWRTLANACAGFAGTVAVGFLVRPAESLTYWTEATFDDSRLPFLPNALNQSVNGLLLRMTDGHGAFWVWVVACGVLGVLCLVAANLWWSRGERALAVSLAALVALFASPLTWLHHWAWFIPLAVGLYRASVRAGIRTRVAAVLAVCWALVFARGPHRWLPAYDWVSGVSPELDWSAWQMVVGHAYLWAGLFAVVYLIALTRRVPPPRPRTQR